MIRINCNAHFLCPNFPISSSPCSQSLSKIIKMLNLSGLPAPVPGLAHALDEPSPPLAQNFPISPLQQDNNSAIAHLEPQQAITLLLDQHDDNIFAYLRFVRSLDQNVHYSPGHGPLSSHQVAAVGALRNCADDEIRTWLEQARKLCADISYISELQELTPNSKRS